MRAIMREWVEKATETKSQWKAPNSKHEAPEKLQASSSKMQSTLAKTELASRLEFGVSPAARLTSWGRSSNREPKNENGQSRQALHHGLPHRADHLCHFLQWHRASPHPKWTLADRLHQHSFWQPVYSD